MALAEFERLGAGVELELPPPHPATTAASSKAINHISGLVILSNLFILFSSYLIQKNIGANDRPLAGNCPSVLSQYPLLTCFAFIRATLWAVPIQHRINRSQGTSHINCTIPLLCTSLRALAHIMQIIFEIALWHKKSRLMKLLRSDW